MEILKGNGVTKIVINRCFGGFGLSELAMIDYADKKGYEQGQRHNHYFVKTPDGEILDCDIPRDDPDLVATVEMMGEHSWGPYAELLVVEIPDDVKWVIEEYDGREWVAERHRVWP